jgi:O-6-methylguanine DNA methyltransferase
MKDKGVMGERRLYYASYGSPVGVICVVASDEGLVSLDFVRTEAAFIRRARVRREVVKKDQSRFKALFNALDGYFSGKCLVFDFKLDLSGTPFQIRVWNALKAIPYGETMSYSELAAKAGSPQGARAAGGACGKNPLPIVVPCHRVIAANGSLGGYSCGVSIKRVLLRIEGVDL